MKSGKGARKHEQAVPWQQEAGTAPGRWQIPNPRAHPAPGSPRAPAQLSLQEGAWDLLATEEKLWGSW